MKSLVQYLATSVLASSLFQQVCYLLAVNSTLLFHLTRAVHVFLYTQSFVMLTCIGGQSSSPTVPLSPDKGHSELVSIKEAAQSLSTVTKSDNDGDSTRKVDSEVAVREDGDKTKSESQLLGALNKLLKGLENRRTTNGRPHDLHVRVVCV